jgi:hypothetical protein
VEGWCEDGADNDGDGAADCSDPDCFGAPGCEVELDCTDALDNDGDGLADCLDEDCVAQPACGQVLLSEDFATFPPPGWLVDPGSAAAASTWTHCDPAAGCGGAAGVVALAGAAGSYVFIDDSATDGTDAMEALVSAPFDCTGTERVLLVFTHFYRAYFDSDGWSSGSVQVSTGGGWASAASFTSTSDNGEVAVVDLTPWAAGASDVRVRLVWSDGGRWAWYWLVDSFVVYGG